MSGQAVPVSGCLQTTYASGAGGEKRCASYVGIGLRNLHGEVGGLLRMNETWALDPNGPLDLHVGDQNVDLGILR